MSKYFCAAPFITTYAWPSGKVSPCCVISSAEMGNINDSPLDEIINHPVYQDLRSNMLSNKPSEMCNKCYVEEEATGKSTRTYFNDMDLGGVNIELNETIKDFKMYYWDIRFSNLCNFKCRMCSPFSSTQWYEDQDFYGDNYTKTLTSINDVDAFFEENLNNLKHLKSVYLAGGEPMIQPEHYRFLSKLIEHGVTDISLHYQTNGSFISHGGENIFEYLKHFKEVRLSLSFDGTKDVVEYIRTGVNWQKTFRNLKEYSDCRHKDELNINFVISAYNILDVTDFFDTMERMGFVEPSNIMMNQVTIPEYLRPSVLPKELRDKARKKILASKWMKKFPEKFKMALDLLDVDNDKYFMEFIAKTKELDKKRNTDISVIIPELSKYMHEGIELMNETVTRTFNVYCHDMFVFVGVPNYKTLEDYFSQYNNVQQLRLEVDKALPYDYDMSMKTLIEYGFDLKDRPIITTVQNPYEAAVDMHAFSETETSFDEWTRKQYTAGSDRLLSRIAEEADYTIRTTFLEFDLHNTCHRIGIEYFEGYKLPKTELQKHYSRYYTPASTELVGDYFNWLITQYNFKLERPSTVCVTAESSLRTLTDASCQICCMNTRTLKNDKGEIFSVDIHSIDEIWNSASRLEIINDLRDGIQHPSCKKCWDEEAAGLESRRIRDNKYNGVTPAKNYDHPTLYEFNLGTVCNIKCRSCGPWSSSKWLGEYFDTGLAEIDRANSSGTEWSPEKMDIFRKHIEGYSKSYRDDSHFWDDIKSHMHEVQHMDFYGGEPFLVKNQWKLLEYAIEHDYAKDITIHYNTNGTLWDKKKVALLNEFKKVKIDFSIDGIEKRFEFTRHPAKWSRVKKHLLEAVELYGKDVAICHTVSAMNMYYVDEMLLWAEENGVQIYLNLVHGPEWYNIKNIPESVKKAITTKLKDNLNNNMSGWFSLNGVIEFMNGETADPKAWDRFKMVTVKVDHNRNESFKETFPEYFEIIKENGEW